MKEIKIKHFVPFFVLLHSIHSAHANCTSCLPYGRYTHTMCMRFAMVLDYESEYGEIAYKKDDVIDNCWPPDVFRHMDADEQPFWGVGCADTDHAMGGGECSSKFLPLKINDVNGHWFVAQICCCHGPCIDDDIMKKEEMIRRATFSRDLIYWVVAILCILALLLLLLIAWSFLSCGVVCFCKCCHMNLQR